MSIAVLCDFDDTITLENVAHLILERFGDGSWREVRRRYLDGLASAEDYFEEQFAKLGATRSEMQAHVRVAGSLRDGFVELAGYCRERDIELAVVTVGLDFYVEALLEQHGLGWIPTYAVGTSFTSGGMQFQQMNSGQLCQRWGICKCEVVERYRENGRRVVYVGDGRNDLCPARRSDVVFARDELLRLCREEGIPFHRFDDFTDVMAGLDRL
ncbi:MAG: MtnX-like HAD-IB family phosphatase [Chloroflexi bacterium]|nr:MtnX-like HAD-IB family phosphatase [Chloroflexota bacterium]